MMNDPSRILFILTSNHMEKDVIEWKDNIVPPTEFWYDANDNCIHTNCGVTIPFIYDVRTQMARCRYDVIMAVKKHYAEQMLAVTAIDD